MVLDVAEAQPTLVLGSLPLTKANLEELSSNHGGKLAVVSLNAAWELVLKEADLKTIGIDMLRLPTPDFFAPSLKDIEKGVTFIEQQLASGTTVLCHCNAGRGRSAVVVLCFLMKHCGMKLKDAFAHVKARRKIAKLSICCGLRPQWRACKSYEQQLQRLPKDPETPSQDAWANEPQVGPRKAGSAKVQPTTGDENEIS